MTENNSTTVDLRQQTEQRSALDEALDTVSNLKKHLDVAEDNFIKAKLDWAKLNEKLNYEADNRDWCGEYDDILEQLNGSFKLLKLETRRKQYSVRTEVTLKFYVNVPMQATSEENAIDYVDGEDFSNIFAHMRDNLSLMDYDDYEWDAKTAEVIDE
jgi:hypothetical protein